MASDPSWRMLETELIRRRRLPANMAAAVEDALAAALPEGAPPVVCETGRRIAALVAAHGASFSPCEPAYHNQYHQAEATLTMGWLCAGARRLGLLTAGEAALGVLAMAGHDLLHHGQRPTPGALEARSAALTAALAGRAGLDEAAQAELSRLILATDPTRPAAARAADDLLCRLAQEADLFASLTPELGWHLSHNLASEMAAAGYSATPAVDSQAGRLAFLRALPPISAPAQALGLAEAVAAQIAALAQG